MTPASPKAPRRGLEAFASRDFRRYQLARVAVILGAEAQSVAVAWQVYSITHRAIDLGYTGLALFLPGLIFLLPAGHVADRFDRRLVILACYALQCICTGALVVLARNNTQNILAIYAVLFFVGTGRAFSGPGELGADSAPCAGDSLCQRGHVGRRHLSTGQHYRAGAGRICCSHFRWHAFCAGLAAGGRGHCVCVHAGNAGWFLVLVSTLQRAAGAHGAPRLLDESGAGGIPICAAGADSAGIVFAGPVCGAAGRGHGADADLCARDSAPGSARPGHAARGAGRGRGGDVAGHGAVSAAPARGALAVYLRVDLRRGDGGFRIVAHACGCRWLRWPWRARPTPSA